MTVGGLGPLYHRSHLTRVHTNLPLCQNVTQAGNRAAVELAFLCLDKRVILLQPLQDLAVMEDVFRQSRITEGALVRPKSIINMVRGVGGVNTNWGQVKGISKWKQQKTGLWWPQRDTKEKTLRIKTKYRGE